MTYAFNRQLHIFTYQRLKEGCSGNTSPECRTIDRMGGVRSGMPSDDLKIPASRVVENADADGKVVSYTLVDHKTNQPTMMREVRSTSCAENPSLDPTANRSSPMERR